MWDQNRIAVKHALNGVESVDRLSQYAARFARHLVDNGFDDDFMAMAKELRSRAAATVLAAIALGEKGELAAANVRSRIAVVVDIMLSSARSARRCAAWADLEDIEQATLEAQAVKKAVSDTERAARLADSVSDGLV